MTDAAIAGSAKSRLFQALRWQYIANLGLGALGALYILVLAKILGSHGFGVYAIVTATPTVIFNLFDYRLQEVLIYFHAQVSKNEKFSAEDIAAVFSIDGIARLLGLTISVAVGLVVNATMGLGVSSSVIILASLAMLLTKICSAPAMGLLRVRERLNVFVSLQLTDWTLRLISLLALAALGQATLQNILIAQCVCAGLINFSVLYIAAREFRSEFSGRLPSRHSEMVTTIRNHWRILGANQGISVMDSVVKEADTLIVGYILSVQASGIYKMTKNFVGIAWRAADPVYIAVMPILSQFWAARNLGELNRFVSKMTQILVLASIALFGVSCLCVYIAVYYFLGPEYAMTATIYPIASCWIIFAMPLIWTHSLAIAAGVPVLQTWASAIGNSVGLVALFAGATFLGLGGAAAGLSVAFALPFVLACVFLHRQGIFAWSK